MKKIFIVLFIVFSLLMLVACGNNKEAKEGYAIRKEEQIKFYVANGIDKENVEYSSCSYIVVKEGNERKFYYKANLTVTFSSTQSRTSVDYFEWIEGTIYTSPSTQSEYEEILSKVNDKTLDGDIGELKK